MKYKYPALYNSIWFLGATITVVVHLEVALTQILLGLCCGKKINTCQNSSDGELMIDCKTWPRLLTFDKDMRILPWHIILAIATVGEFMYPNVFQSVVKWFIVGAFGTLIAYFVSYILHDLAGYIGDPFPTDIEYDEKVWS